MQMHDLWHYQGRPGDPPRRSWLAVGGGGVCYGVAGRWGESCVCWAFVCGVCYWVLDGVFGTGPADRAVGRGVGQRAVEGLRCGRARSPLSTEGIAMNSSPAVPPSSGARTAVRRRPTSLLERCCGCCWPKRGFKRFDDEGPSAEFRQRMERASTAMALNAQTKSRMKARAMEVVPVPAERPTSSTTHADRSDTSESKPES